ncbi:MULTISPECIES: hypothetical protein [Aphanothece]|uniref:hypothetical protein n=1 Tax=Aphanothece TaxID=1121 RepID=UPI00398E3300
MEMIQAKDESQAKETVLIQQVGWLRMKLKRLRQHLSGFDAHELRKLVEHGHPGLRVNRQCALLGLRRSTVW